MRYIIFIFMIFSLFLSPVFAEDEDSGKEKQKIYHVFNDVDLIPATNIQYDRPRIVIKSVYPKLESGMPDENIDIFNNQVESVIQNEVSGFKLRVTGNKSIQQTIPKKRIKNDLNVDFDTAIINTSDNPIISIRFTFQQLITGLAHPTHYHRVLNFDFETGAALQLEDLFLPESNYLGVISDYSRLVLSKKLKNHRNNLTVGTAPIADNFKNWNINPSGLRITFDESQVAPYIFGTQTVLIPYSALKDILSPDSPLAKCLKHRRRCLSENLLTGGFMDEA
ncbi:MAG: Endo-1,4-beta-xylanase-like protein [uncultured bacterium]|nr:MAG: Endo-1,4-beta-xylanase-like protein [uncultured bacterium]